MLDTTNRIVVSQMANDLRGNQILKIAAEVRELKAKGERVADLTIGDFYAPEFPIPSELRDRIKLNLDEGYTNYPPPQGTQELRNAVAAQYKQEMGVDCTPEQVLVGSGTRPLIFAAYMAILDPSDVVVYGVPSWNNNHYCHIMGAVGHAVQTTVQNNFMLSQDDIEPYMGRVVLIALNTPQNPSGTVMQEATLHRICERVLEENRTRIRRGDKPVYVLYDQPYWRLIYNQEHVHPVKLFPEMQDYTIYADGASKNLAGTGLRVGWAVLPQHLVGPMANIVSHMGAWAPKAEQLAVAGFLPMQEANARFIAKVKTEMKTRLDALHSLLQRLNQAGIRVDSIQPQGGLFLSVYFGLEGYRTPSGEQLKTSEDIRHYLLREGKCAVVPFAAFGDIQNPAWFRASVSGLSREDFAFGMKHLETALRQLKLG